jgi:hypothetical protein
VAQFAEGEADVREDVFGARPHPQGHIQDSWPDFSLRATLPNSRFAAYLRLMPSVLSRGGAGHFLARPFA